MWARHLTQPNYRYNDGKMAFYYMEKSRALKFTHLPLPTTAIPVEAGGGQGWTRFSCTHIVGYKMKLKAYDLFFRLLQVFMNQSAKCKIYVYISNLVWDTDNSF